MAALITLVVAGCSSKEEDTLQKFCNLYEKMSREQVREVMGEPNCSADQQSLGQDRWYFDSNNKQLPYYSTAVYEWAAVVDYKKMN